MLFSEGCRSNFKKMIMKEFFYKVIISLLISSSALYLAEINSQAQPNDCDRFSLLISKWQELWTD